MRVNSGVKFFLVIFIIGILTYITVTGELFGKKIGGFNDMNWGIDIRGGVRAILTPPDGVIPKGNEMSTAKRIIETRLDNLQIYDKEVTLEKNSNRILVQIPWKQGETDFDAQKTIDETIQTAKLTFQEVDENQKSGTGPEDYKPTGKIILDGTEVKSANAETNSQTGEVEVSLEFKDSGSKKFAEATQRLYQKKIGIFLDEKCISAPNVNAVITDGRASITGNFKMKEAAKLADLIESGNLPFSLKAIDIGAISPEMGQNAKNVSVQAMMVAIMLVWLFMLIYYRLPGMLANIALLAHTVIQLLILSWLGISVTLPGIAGIILTIGMGVDANIIIFERIKEELRNGKTLRASIDVGFKRAFTAVLDANMTTLISACVLYYFGSGPIRSFAITLGLGVALSFLTAVVVSRIMLKAVADSKVDLAKHPWLYGVKKVDSNKEVKA